MYVPGTSSARRRAKMTRAITPTNSILTTINFRHKGRAFIVHSVLHKIMGRSGNLESKRGVGPAFVLVIGALAAGPGTFSYYVLVNALREQNLCHVGPISLQTNSLDTIPKFEEQRASLSSLYGTYTTFDDASYYFVKTPYPISPQVLPDYGYWSISTLALTMLSPFLRRQRQANWKSLEDTYEIDTAPAIHWDQSHESQYIAPDQHASKSNRWCLLNRQDPKMYHHSVDDISNAVAKTPHGVHGTSNAKSTLFRICAAPQASILSSGDQAPYFIELPLHAPMAGIWKKYESDSVLDKIDDDDNEGSFAKYRRSRRPTNPYQLQVQCHVRNLELRDLAHGSLQPDSMPNLGWEHAETIEVPIWNVFYLPGTLVILLGLLLVHLRRRPSLSRPRQLLVVRERTQEVAEDWNLLQAVQLLWFQDSWQQLCLTSFWVCVIGALLEPVVGTMTYLGATILFLQLIAVISNDSCFLWICFGQSILLAQIEASLSIGPVDISSISLGVSRHALKLNAISVLLALILFVMTATEIPWRTAAVCLLVGWSLAEPLVLELLGAPQWTIPSLLLGHLWWKLTKLSDLELKKTDEEAESLRESDDEDEEDDDYCEDMSKFSSSSTVVTVDVTIKHRLLQYIDFLQFPVLIGSWLLLTFVCVSTMDWTLVVGNMMSLWIYIGCNQLPLYSLWPLYHMVASSIMIVFNVMTLTGWHLCHVAIAVRALHVLPSRFVYASMALQTMAHCIALLHTAHTKNWDTSRSVPGHYFWSNIRVLAEELRLWFRVFC